MEFKTLIVAGKVKELATYEGRSLNVGCETYKALTEKVEAMIKEASKRAISNHRTTILPRDL